MAKESEESLPPLKSLLPENKGKSFVPQPRKIKKPPEPGPGLADELRGLLKTLEDVLPAIEAQEKELFASPADSPGRPKKKQAFQVKKNATPPVGESKESPGEAT